MLLQLTTHKGPVWLYPPQIKYMKLSDKGDGTHLIFGGDCFLLVNELPGTVAAMIARWENETGTNR